MEHLVCEDAANSNDIEYLYLFDIPENEQFDVLVFLLCSPWIDTPVHIVVVQVLCLPMHGNKNSYQEVCLTYFDSFSFFFS